MAGKGSKNLGDDLDLIRRAMSTSQRIPLSEQILGQRQNLAKTKDIRAQKPEPETAPKILSDNEIAEAKKELALFNKGYELLIADINEKSINSEFRASPELAAIPVEKCLINDALMAQLQEALISIGLNKSCYLDKACGYTNAILINFYEIGVQYYQQAIVDKAIAIFTFLTNLTPDIETFWIALGLALERNQEYQKAIKAYEFVIAMDLPNFTPFFGLIRCCEELRDFSLALELLQKEKERGKEELRGDLEGAFAYIESNLTKSH